jgi:predicted DNA-binding transcriptional regulator
MTFFIELHRRIGQYAYNLLLSFLKQVTLKNAMYGKGNLNRNLVNDIWLAVC